MTISILLNRVRFPRTVGVRVLLRTCSAVRGSGVRVFRGSGEVGTAGVPPTEAAQPCDPLPAGASGDAVTGISRLGTTGSDGSVGSVGSDVGGASGGAA